jgi:putative acetyltransferase
MTIQIRRVEPNDYEALREVFAGPRVIWGTLQLPFPSVEMWRKRLAERGDDVVGLVACADCEVIGQLDLFTFPNAPRRKHAGRLGMVVRDDWQGKGAGSALLQAAITLADRWLNLSRLELEVFTDNPAVGLYEKFGFRVEGTLKRYAFRDGKYVDAYTMARLGDQPLGKQQSS